MAMWVKANERPGDRVGTKSFTFRNSETNGVITVDGVDEADARKRLPTPESGSRTYSYGPVEEPS